jgi:ABC-type transport system substrate-binding protein
VSDEDLNAAQLENDPAKRHMMYQEIERRVLKIAYFIPIKNEYTYILTDRSIEFDLKQAAEWGLQLYKLKLKQLP